MLSFLGLNNSLLSTRRIRFAITMVPEGRAQVPSTIAEEAPAAALGPGRGGRIQPRCRAAEHQPELCNTSYKTRNRAGLPWFQVSHHALGFSQVTQAWAGEIWG